MAIIAMRAVDRAVGKGQYKKDNVAWCDNVFGADLAVRVGAEPVEVSNDYIEFNKALLAKD